MDMNANQQPLADTGIAARLLMPFAALMALMSASCCVLPIGLSILGLGGAWLTMRGPFAALGGVSAAFYAGFVEIDTMKNKLLALGVGGTILAILCCFTPLLPVVLAALGLTGLLGVVYSDAVLLPILAGFLILTGYAIWRQKTQK